MCRVLTVVAAAARRERERKPVNGIVHLDRLSPSFLAADGESRSPPLPTEPDPSEGRHPLDVRAGRAAPRTPKNRLDLWCPFQVSATPPKLSRITSASPPTCAGSRW